MLPEAAALPIMDYVAQENACRKAASGTFLVGTYKEVRGFRTRGTLPPGATAADVFAAIWAL